MRKKKTALQIPGDRKASPNQTKGLVAKGEKPRQSGQEGCVLDNHSHRTPCRLPEAPSGAYPKPPLCMMLLNPRACTA